jgi:hypothetical protein
VPFTLRCIPKRFGSLADALSAVPSKHEAREQAYRAAHPGERLYVFFAAEPIAEGLGVRLGRW